jgi:peptidoglycan hydrolase CwlO-like protein
MEICLKVKPENMAQPDSDTIKAMDENIKKLLINQIKIMALIDELNAKVASLQTQVTELQTTIDTEQAQIQQLIDTNAQVVTDLNNQKQALEQQLANSGSPEQLQAVINSIDTIANSLTTSKTDLENTVSPAQ